MQTNGSFRTVGFIRRTIWPLALCLLFSGLSRVQLAAADFYVAANGNDANPGTISAPYLTLTQAQASVRATLPSATGPINVWVRGGAYYLGQTLNFGPADSGSDTVPVTYSAYSNEVVTLSGAIKLNPTWTTYSGNIMVANIGTNLDIDGLFVNGLQQVLARYPNYNTNAVILDGYDGTCTSSNRAARWSNPTTGFVRGLQSSEWGGVSFEITGINSSTGIPNMQWVGDNNRGDSLSTTYVMVENLFEELDTTNEWFYNKTTGNLYFWPPAGLNLATATVEAAAVTELIGFRGAATNNTVSHITLSGFVFTQTHRSLFNTPYEGPLRGDWGLAREGTIFMSNADFITIQNSTFTNIGGNGIFMSAHNRTNIVNNCDFENVGATCVQIVGLMSATRYPSTWSDEHTDIEDTTPGPLTDDYPMGCIVSSNYMYNLGVFEKEPAGVNVCIADSIIVSHNTIHTSPRAGINIMCGCFGGDIIEFNDVWDCVRETGDHGPFNSWGRDRFWTYPDGVEGGGTYGTQKRPYAFLDCWKPTIIRNNRFQYSSVQNFGIDLDDGSSNYQIYNNVLLNTNIKLRDGFSRHVYNNIIINLSCDLQVSYDTCQDQLDHNIIITGSPWALTSVDSNNITAKQYMIDTNFFWNGGGSIMLPFATWTNMGYDVHSLTVDPQFSNPAANDYTVNNAQILAAGFTNIPMNEFGTTWPGVPTAPPISNVSTGGATADPEPLMDATITSIYSTEVEGSAGLPDTNGVYFQTVPAGSYAASQGFMANDVIRQINGITVTSKQSFWTNYTVIAPGTSVNLVLWRNATTIPFTFVKMGGSEQLNETAGTSFIGSGWQVQENSSCYNGDIHFTTVNGDNFQFSFYGTGIQFLSEMYSDEGNVDVYIDGAFDKTINCSNSTRLYQQVVYTKQGLTPGVHTVNGVKDNSSYMLLDAFVVLQSVSAATNLTWRGDGVANNWDIQTTFDWLNSGSSSAFYQGDNVTFDDTGSNSPAINLNGVLQPGNVTVNAAQSYVFGGAGQLGGGMSLTKGGSGTLTLNTANTFTGGTTISNGTLQLNNAGAAGTGGIVVNPNGTLALPAGTGNTFNNAVSGSGTINASGTGSEGYVQIGGSMSAFSGDINVGFAGAARFVNRSANGSLGAGVTVDVTTNGQLYLQSGTCAAAVNVSGFGDGDGFGAIRIDPGASLSGSVNLTGNATLGSLGTGSISGNIGDNGNGYGLTVTAGGISYSGISGLYHGNTTINNNATLVLVSGAMIENSAAIEIASNSTFDVSSDGVASYPIPTGIGGASATQTLAGINENGIINGNMALGSGGSLGVAIAKDGQPSLIVQDGTLTLTNNAVTVVISGGALSAGSYKLIAKGTGGLVAGTVAGSSLVVNGSGLAFGNFGSLQMTNGGLYLVVQPLAPPVLSSFATSPGKGFDFGFSGPNGQSYRVLASTNLAAPLADWLTLTNGVFGTGVVNYTDGAAINTQEFYRIASP
jgi:autotransporter-associated beta strand protein